LFSVIAKRHSLTFDIYYRILYTTRTAYVISGWQESKIEALHISDLLNSFIPDFQNLPHGMRALQNVGRRLSPGRTVRECVLLGKEGFELAKLIELEGK